MNYLLAKEKKYKEHFFYIATIIMTIKILIHFNGIFELPSLIENIMIVTSILLYCIHIYNIRYYTLNEIIVCTVIGIVIFYTCIITKDYVLIMSFLLILSSIKMDIRKVITLIYNIKVCYIISLILIYISLCITTNYLGNEIIKNGRIALSLGFSHPNTAGLILFWMILEKLYLDYENINFAKKISVMLKSILIYTLTGCRTVVIMGLILFILIIIEGKRIENIIKYISKYIFIVLSVFIILAMNIYMNQSTVFYNLIKNIDEITTGRICIGAKLLSIYNWSIFGQQVELGKVVYDSYYKLTSVTIDGIYIDLFIRYGLGYIIIMGSLICNYFNEERKYIDHIIIILFSIYGLSETQILYTVIAFPLLIVSTDFFKKKSINNKNKLKNLRIKESNNGLGECNYTSI